MSYAPVLDLKRFKQSLITLIVIAIPKNTNINVPTVVSAPAPELAVASQNNVEKPVRNSEAKSAIKPKPLFTASIIAAPILSGSPFLFYNLFITWVFAFLIYIDISRYIYKHMRSSAYKFVKKILDKFCLSSIPRRYPLGSFILYYILLSYAIFYFLLLPIQDYQLMLLVLIRILLPIF